MKSLWIIDTTDATFETDVIARSHQLPVVVDFWAEWCQPCRQLGPILEKVAADHDGKFLLAKANTDQAPAAATSCGVQGIPAVFGFRNGEIADFFAGIMPEDQFRLWVSRILPTPAEEAVAEARLLEATDQAAAESKYREAIALDGDLAPAKIGLARLLVERDRIEDARQLVEQLERRGFLEPEAEKLKAQLEVQAKGNEVGDVAQCRAAATAEPDNHALRLKLAESLAADGQYEEALQLALDLIRSDKQQFGDTARQVMINIFQLLPDDSELTGTYRRQLSTALY